MSIVDKVGELCGAKKITIAELERSLGLGAGTVSRWDTRIPGIDKVQKVADYFQVSTDYLLGRTETPYYALTEKDEPSIQADLERLIEDLDGLKYSKETEEFSEETKELLIASLEQAVRIAKMEAKRKYTPKKYRGES